MARAADGARRRWHDTLFTAHRPTPDYRIRAGTVRVHYGSSPASARGVEGPAC